MLKEQQHCNLIQQQDEQNNHVVEQQLVIPLTTTIPSVVDLTIMAHCDKNGDNTAVNVENGTTIIKQVLYAQFSSPLFYVTTAATNCK